MQRQEGVAMGRDYKSRFFPIKKDGLGETALEVCVLQVSRHPRIYPATLLPRGAQRRGCLDSPSVSLAFQWSATRRSGGPGGPASPAAR